MKMRKAIILTTVIGLVGVLAAGCSKKSSTTTTTYQEVTVSKGTVTVSITSTGTLDYSNYENLFFGTDGTVGAVNVKVGDLVKKDQVLATLDADAWNQQLDNLNQAVQTAQRNLTTAQSNLAKAKRQVITQQLAVSQAQLDVQTAQNNLNNISAVKTAQDAVDAAQANLNAAQASLLVAEAQGDAATVTYLNTYITQSLKPVLSQVKQNLQQVLNGTGTSITTTVALQIASTQLQVSQKQNALIGTQAAVDDANTVVANAQTDETSAEQAVKDAQKALDEAKAASIEITAPFDGAVTTVNISPGVGLSGSSSGVVKKGATAIVVADTSKFKANLMVNEMDVPNVSLGMLATVQPSALTNLTLPAMVTAISPVATTQSGVVNYAVTATVLSVSSVGAGRTTQAGTSGSASQSGTTTPPTSSGSTGQTPSTTLPTSPGQSRTSGTFPTTLPSGTAGRTGGFAQQSNATATPTLRQGLSLVVNLIEQQKQNVLVVPNQAVKTQASTSTVLVKTSSGATEQRQVTIGLKDVQYTEIVSGLNEGDVVLIAKTTTTGTTTTQTTQGGFAIPGLGGLGR